VPELRNCRAVLRVTALAFLLAAGLAAAATAAEPRSGERAPQPSVPACALGTSAADLRGFYAAELERAERRFGGGRAARRAFSAGVAAYVYGRAPVAVHETIKGFPANQLISIAALANPSTRAVVLPNNDTTYTTGRLDLSGGPVVLDVPDTAGRYYVVQLLDAYSNTFAYVGRRATGTRAGAFAISPPGFRGALPSGIRRIESPTGRVWALGRTLVGGAADLPAVTELMRGYRVTGLAAWTAGMRQAPAVLPIFPPLPPTPLPAGTEFFETLRQILRSDPPPARDACALRAFARVGPGIAQVAVREGERLVRRAEQRANRYSARRNNGWLIPGPYVGNYGRNYLGRAVIAAGALGANTRPETVYPLATSDSRGRPLSGAHRYVIRFPRGQLPPARAFWSLTMYGRDRYLVENEARRYSIGDRTPGLRRGDDGSLRIVIQHRRPAGDAASNWLPAPPGRFRVALRLYEPRRAVLSGAWRPPPIKRAD
jgi:hypothetical protein